jgi:gluconolactonase
MAAAAGGCGGAAPPSPETPVAATGGSGADDGSAAAADGASTTTAGASATGGPCGSGGPYPSPVAQGDAQLVYQGTGKGLFEGPVWVAATAGLYFSEMTFSKNPPPSVIHKFSPADGSTSPFVAESGTNGLALRGDGRILGATHQPQGLAVFDPATAERHPVAITYQGQHFNSPNDLTIRADGNVYFTDPDWQLGQRKSETGKTGVYRVLPDSPTVALVDDTLDKPNGIALSPDGNTLYVADFNGGGNQGRVGTYPVAADGSTGARTEFAAGVAIPDGMTVDCAGNLYTTSHEAGMIGIYSSAGTQLGAIQVAPSLTNVAFGGVDGKTLYATAGKALYAIAMNLPGYPY